MIFNSLEYGIFLPLVFVVYWRLSLTAQNAFLLLASYVFYGWWDYRFLGLIWLSTIIDYSAGRALEHFEDERRRKLVVLVSVAGNLGILGTFKYFDFFSESAASLLRGMGWEVSPVFLAVALPVGISFYTFQTLSYTIDVYRRQLEPSRNLLTFSLFVAYFPQLVAGPIERAGRLIPQLAAPREKPGPDRIESGLLLILLGLVKKVVLADVMAPVVDQIFTRSATVSSLELVVGMVGAGIQVYCDFSGYSDIARGSSRLLGIELMHNFRQPFLSRNITEFWQRWHTSLAMWFRDYVYIPLGGNRGGPNRTTLNLLLSFTLLGLWHGAAWRWILWGLSHGIFVAVHRRLVGNRSEEAPLRATPRQISGILVTFVVFHLTAPLFRATSMARASSIYEGLLDLRWGATNAVNVASVVLALGVTITIDFIQRKPSLITRDGRVPSYVLGPAFGAGITALIFFSGSTSVPFFYFQF